MTATDDRANASISIEKHIKQLEELATSGTDDSIVEDLCRRIDNIYANYFGDNRDLAYTTGLYEYGFASGKPLDVVLRAEKLRSLYDKLKHEESVAGSRRLNPDDATTQAQSQKQETNVNVNVVLDLNVSITATFERIEQLPEVSLSANEKEELKKRLKNLADGDETEREGKLQKLLHWLGDKGVDVAIAVLPYVIKAINPDLAS